MTFEDIDFTDLRASDIRRMASCLTDDQAFDRLGEMLNVHLDGVFGFDEHDLEHAFILGAQIRTAVEQRPDRRIEPDIHIRMGNYSAVVAFTHGFGGRSFLDALAVVEKGPPRWQGRRRSGPRPTATLSRTWRTFSANR